MPRTTLTAYLASSFMILASFASSLVLLDAAVVLSSVETSEEILTAVP